MRLVFATGAVGSRRRQEERLQHKGIGIRVFFIDGFLTGSLQQAQMLKVIDELCQQRWADKDHVYSATTISIGYRVIESRSRRTKVVTAIGYKVSSLISVSDFAALLSLLPWYEDFLY